MAQHQVIANSSAMLNALIHTKHTPQKSQNINQTLCFDSSHAQHHPSQ
jgi:hypothetical protein